MSVLDQDLKSLSLRKILTCLENEKDLQMKDFLRKIKSEKLKLSNPNLDEKIKVVNDNILPFIGFMKYNDNINSLINDKSCVLERSYAEYDSRFRQLVANLILEVTDESGNRKFGFLKRENFYKTELSIHGAISMIGGHVSAEDKSLLHGLRRELSEEVSYFEFDNSQIKPIGFIREISDNISSNHLCILFVLKLNKMPTSTIRSKENKQTFLWISEEDVRKSFVNNFKDYDFDSWVKLALVNYVY